jgi:hypothetical protein
LPRFITISLQKIFVIDLSSLTERCECFEDLCDASTTGGFETRRNLLRRLKWSGAESVLDRANLVREVCGPGLLAACGGVHFGGDEAAERGLDGEGVGGLKVGAEPADEAGGFFGAALGVEVDYVLEDLFGGEVRRPAVGGKDGVVEFVMSLAEDGDEASIVDGAVGFGVAWSVMWRKYLSAIWRKEELAQIRLLRLPGCLVPPRQSPLRPYRAD